MGALALACAVTSLGALALVVTTGAPWLTFLIQPFCFLLLPGFVLDMIPRNVYFFSQAGVLNLSALVYFLLFAHLFRRKV